MALFFAPFAAGLIGRVRNRQGIPVRAPSGWHYKTRPPHSSRIGGSYYSEGFVRERRKPLKAVVLNESEETQTPCIRPS
jgi:hypothetical protein